MNELALFSGAGGGILGSHLLGWKTVCAVEIEDYPRRVLLARQKDGILPQFPIWDDVSTFDGKPWKGRVDIITGGFPCQDISCAGKGAGITGKRSGLWSEMARIIGEVRPRYAFMENSPMLVRRGLAVVISDLAEMGYACRWGIVGAHHAGGPHKRDRIWILANTSSQRRKGSELRKALHGNRDRQETHGSATQCRGSWWDIDPADLPDTQCERLQGGKPATGQTASLRRRSAEQDKKVSHTDNSRFQTPGTQHQATRVINDRAKTERAIKPQLGGMADELAHRLVFFRAAFGGEVPRVGIGIPNRVARLKAIGNGQVPMAHNLAVKFLIG